MQPRALRLGLACVACALLSADLAHAGTYEVLSCGASSGINRSWVPFNGDPTSLRAEDSCASILGGAEDGLFGTDRIPGPPNTPGGQEAGWRIVAPTGTRITQLTLQYYLGQTNANEWLPFIRTAEGNVLQSCVPPGGQTTCERGATPYSPFGPADSFAVDTAGLELGVRCAAATGQCGTGATLHHVWAALYGARVQVTDASSPIIQATNGELWRDRYHRGAESLAITATDNTGIRATRLLVDNQARTTESRLCDYTLTVPCSNGAGATLTFDTRTLADGQHTLVAAADDPAGNTTSTTRSIVVDNTAPSAPVGLQLDGAARRSANRFDVHWQNPGDQIAPIVAARWSLCPAAKTMPCSEGAKVQPSIDSLDALEVPSSGDWDLRVWLEDAAGNASSDRAAGPLRLSLAGASGRNPGVRIRGVSRRGRLVRVRGVAEPASGRVRVSVERRVGSRLLRVRGIAGIREGRWNRGLRLTSRMARLRRLSVVVRFEAQDGYRAVTARRRVPR
ncbi:hypothetical protein [Solirubrobacter soli]|uniref:hypothetical protein n=1 Tax=Solirubrobacter soli TaxID=363832 RepID=UPI0012FC6E67|nr:hypothetical protein [Solirubrobacter soli]